MLSKNICDVCFKSIGIYGFKCKCGKLFCSKHINSYNHQCEYNYFKDHQEKIRKENPIVKPEVINF